MPNSQPKNGAKYQSGTLLGCQTYSFNKGLPVPQLWVSITNCLPHSQGLTQFQCQDEQNGEHVANKGTCLSLSKLAGGNTHAARLSCVSQLLHLFHPLLLLQP